jgi:hypothetical protein
MTREVIIDLLKNNGYTAFELSQRLNWATHKIENDLEHIRTTVRADPDFQLLINPATCQLCGYQFSNKKIKAPTRCPKCNKEKIKPPTFIIQKR